eukprot:11825619-Alexandrium_andersonii.AAC.1
MQIRAPEAPRGAPHSADSEFIGELWICIVVGSEFPQTPSRGEGRLARRTSWDRDLLGWMLVPGPTSTRGPNTLNLETVHHEMDPVATLLAPGAAPAKWRRSFAA